MKHFNLSSADVGRHISDVSNNICYPTIVENIAEVMKSQEDLEKEIQTTDQRWYQMNVLPYIIQKENKANGIIITFVDITDRIKGLCHGIRALQGTAKKVNPADLILMDDSARDGFVLAQLRRQEKVPHPSQLILLSPGWT